MPLRTRFHTSLPILELMLRTSSEAQQFYLELERWETARTARSHPLTKHGVLTRASVSELVPYGSP